MEPKPLDPLLQNFADISEIKHDRDRFDHFAFSVGRALVEIRDLLKEIRGPKPPENPA